MEAAKRENKRMKIFYVNSHSEVQDCVDSFSKHNENIEIINVKTYQDRHISKITITITFKEKGDSVENTNS